MAAKSKKHSSTLRNLLIEERDALKVWLGSTRNSIPAYIRQEMEISLAKIETALKTEKSKL